MPLLALAAGALTGCAGSDGRTVAANSTATSVTSGNAQTEADPPTDRAVTGYPWDAGPAKLATFAPVLDVRPALCFGRVPSEHDGIDDRCYDLGPPLATDAAVRRARAVPDVRQPGRWNVSLRLTDPPDAAMRGLFDVCYRATPICPGRNGADHGSIAIDVDGYVVTAQRVATADPASGDLNIPLGFTEQQARAVAAAFGA